MCDINEYFSKHCPGDSDYGPDPHSEKMFMQGCSVVGLQLINTQLQREQQGEEGESNDPWDVGGVVRVLTRLLSYSFLEAANS